ncbi:hypothetical protein PPTG_21489 [Phytophthora nicotianae INRA-310]|uniref:Uncharacterized protein n=1 Tax=Phytophthora nicotianae (strain INRA-310) TaxID=761204 RepID=W2R532_PHYN3|nr:hypothetical protein PPTG_21489 [Phytophthora nicotianae INRA-310]ETN19804.1 hypothetical protein PPTG_21489 [Phytophthora nicotianae INRA-310]
MQFGQENLADKPKCRWHCPLRQVLAGGVQGAWSGGNGDRAAPDSKISGDAAYRARGSQQPEHYCGDSGRNTECLQMLFLLSGKAEYDEIRTRVVCSSGDDRARSTQWEAVNIPVLV